MTSTHDVMRIEASFQRLDDKFRAPSHENSLKQYCHLYKCRVKGVSDELMEISRSLWGKELNIPKLVYLKCEERCIVIGTIFKEMKMRPSILREICEQRNLVPQPKKERFTEEDDRLILEDESQRIILTGNIDPHEFVTGVVISVVGVEKENARGVFIVEDYCFPPPPQQTPWPSLPISTAAPAPHSDKFVLFVCGLGLGPETDNLLQIQLLEDFITGNLGNTAVQELSRGIVRVIIAGNSLSSSTHDTEAITRAKYLANKKIGASIEAMKKLDGIVSRLVRSIPVDIMSGPNDPTNILLPQIPLHHCMFPLASKLTTFQAVTNPYECIIDGIRILGTSGQNIEDIYKFSKMDDRLSILEKTLVWRHTTPTAPDTLSCFPFFKEDPFQIQKGMPHIYFAANQPTFQTKLWTDTDLQTEGKTEKRSSGKRSTTSHRSVRLLSLPAFSTKSQCVLVNLHNGEPTLLSMSAFL